jgi:GH15 family glucan-1,4-alpha-glucosidase
VIQSSTAPADTYPTPAPFDAASALEQTETFWTEWCRKGRDAGPLSETVRRSLITLKALTYAPTGGTVQAMYGITGERRLMEWIVPGQDP